MRSSETDTHRSQKRGIRPQEARGHAILAAIILWTGAAISIFASPGDRDLMNQLKGADFVQIYTLAHAAFEGPYPTLSNREAFTERQFELVPASKGDVFLPVYPPTAALIFRPVAAFTYRTATILWVALTIVGYALVVWLAWRPFRDVLPDRSFVLAAAISFPPFFFVVLYGQTTIVPLFAFFLAWLALTRTRSFLAGLALGLLTIKPQLALVVVPVLLAAREGRIILGLILSCAVQVTAVAATMGVQAFDAYFRTMVDLGSVEHLVEPDGWRMHSMRTLTRLIPDPTGDLVWMLLSTAAVVLAARSWLGRGPIGARLGVVIIATILVSPHLFAYDALLLAPTFIWLGAWIESTDSPIRYSYWQGVYATSALLLLPTALLIHVQGSVLVLMWMLWTTGKQLSRANG